MSQPDPMPMKTRMNLEKFVMYSALLGMLTLLVGWAIGSRVVSAIGGFGLLPLLLLYWLAMVVGIVSIIGGVLSRLWKALDKAVSWCLGKRPALGNDTQDQSQS